MFLNYYTRVNCYDMIKGMFAWNVLESQLHFVTLRFYGNPNKYYFLCEAGCTLIEF